MERRKGKRILYSICFICLAFIDWIRGSQMGNVWLTAINLTGVLMSIIMLSHFQWKKEPKKSYLIWLVIWAIGSIAGMGIWRAHPGEVFLSQYWTAAISLCFVGVVAIRVFRERKLLFYGNLLKKALPVCFIVMSVLMTCSPLREIWPLWYAVIFGMFYLIPFSEDERKDLWNGLADGLIISFFMLQIYAYGFRPYDELRYKGAYANCNMNALFYLVTYVMLLYRAHSFRWQEKYEGVAGTWKRKIGKLILWILAAGIWGFVLLTMTRTALLAIIAITVIYGIVEYCVITPEKWWRLPVRGAALMLSIVLAFPAVYLTVRYLPTILHHPVWFEGEYSVDKIHSFDPADSEKYTTLEDVIEGLLGRLEVESVEETSETQTGTTDFPLLVSTEVSGEMIRIQGESVLTAENGAGTEAPGEAKAQGYILTDADAGNSGKIRLEIWKLYLKNMNLTGHELEEGYFQITKGYHAWHAQNVFLQVAFYYGGIAGILFIVILTGLGIQAVRLVIRKQSCEDILPLFVGLLFVGYGLLECVWYPGQTILLLLYLVPKILADGRNEVTMKQLNK